MPSVNSYKYITSATTTTFAGNETSRVLLACININKALTGTLTIKTGGGSGTTLGVLAVGTAAGQYWYTNSGTLIDGLAIINSATEDVTVAYRNI